MTLRTFLYACPDAPAEMRYLVRVGQAERETVAPVIFHAATRKAALRKATAWWQSAARGVPPLEVRWRDAPAASAEAVSEPEVATSTLDTDLPEATAEGPITPPLRANSVVQTFREPEDDLIG